jgi:hypothetical protein
VSPGTAVHRCVLRMADAGIGRELRPSQWQIPGIHAVGWVTDQLGRRGYAMALDVSDETESPCRVARGFSAAGCRVVVRRR